MLMGFIIRGYITNINLEEYQNVLFIDSFLQNLSPVFQLLLIKCYIFKNLTCLWNESLWQLYL